MQSGQLRHLANRSTPRLTNFLHNLKGWEPHKNIYCFYVESRACLKTIYASYTFVATYLSPFFVLFPFILLHNILCKIEEGLISVLVWKPGKTRMNEISWLYLINVRFTSFTYIQSFFYNNLIGSHEHRMLYLTHWL